MLFFSSNDIFIFLYFIFHYIDVLFDVCLFYHLINDFLFSLFFLVVFGLCINLTPDEHHAKKDGSNPKDRIISEHYSEDGS